MAHNLDLIVKVESEEIVVTEETMELWRLWILWRL